MMRRREQHVELLVDEAAHHLLELPLAHLPVRDADARLPGRARARNFCIAAIERTRLWTKKTCPPRFSSVSIASRTALGVELHDEGADGAPVLGRRGDDRQVAHAGEAHVQRARDGRRGEREHVDELAELLQPLLVRDAEALLLVHHEEAEVLERHVGGEQPVRADDDVDLARRRRPSGLPSPPRRSSSARSPRCGPGSP